MNTAEEFQNILYESFEKFRPLLVNTALKKMSHMLQQKVTPEDAVQETFKNACKRPSFFINRQDIPVIRKLQIILQQTIAAQERRHMQSGKRDMFKEESLEKVSPFHHNLPDSAAGPYTGVAQQERKRLILRTIPLLNEKDRRILELRILQNSNNQECSQILGISEKNASIRFIRALHRLQAELSKYTQIS